MTRTSPSTYRFVSDWHLPAAPHECWQALAAIDAWPLWWPGMLGAATFGRPGPDGFGRICPGARARIRVGSPLGYSLDVHLTLTAVDPPRSAVLSVGGDLTGRGEWSAVPEAPGGWQATAPAVPEASGTRVRIGWDVDTALLRVRACGPAAGWAHSRVMAAGQRGLRARLES